MLNKAIQNTSSKALCFGTKSNTMLARYFNLENPGPSAALTSWCLNPPLGLVEMTTKRKYDWFCFRWTNNNISDPSAKQGTKRAFPGCKARSCFRNFLKNHINCPALLYFNRRCTIMKMFSLYSMTCNTLVTLARSSLLIPYNMSKLPPPPLCARLLGTSTIRFMAKQIDMNEKGMALEPSNVVP